MNFNIRITGTIKNPKIVAEGENRHIIKPEDYPMFMIDKERMKSHFEAAWGGGRPKGVYLTNSELPWGDQSYEKYGLQETTIVQKAVRAEILSHESSPFVLFGPTFRNYLDQDAPIEADLRLNFTESISTNWQWDVRAGVENSTTVSAEVGGDAVGGKVGVSNTSTVRVEGGYGQGGAQEKSRSADAGAKAGTVLKPGQAVVLRLSATRGTMVARVWYETKVIGHCWIDYGRRVKLPGRGGPNGHFFYFDPTWAHVPKPNINETQTINVDVKVDASIDLYPMELDGKERQGA